MPPTAKMEATKIAPDLATDMGAGVRGDKFVGPQSGSDGSLPRRPESTPAGLQLTATLAQRRALFAVLSVATLVALAFGVAQVLGAGGWSALDIGLFAAIMLSAPWTILGFWSAVIGLVIRLTSKDPARLVSPHWTDDVSVAPLTDRIAVLMTLRNEDPDRAYQRLLSLRADLDRQQDAGAFDIFILSDSDDPEIVSQERALFDSNRSGLNGAGLATYRRRLSNEGYKAGNVDDFVRRWGDRYELMLPLDADSMMSGAAIVKLARLMRRHTKVGVMQCLALGAPAQSPFGRIFQFGVRISLRSFALGSAWWQGDCGPYWGHNAMIRVRPFRDHCELPVLPGRPPLGGYILSHDQVEAAFMRRAGYEVRVAPFETESWEENPVTLLDFIKREQRWCNGNMQYGALLGAPGLTRTNRFQLLQAMLMYLSAPAWIAMIIFAALKVVAPVEIAEGSMIGQASVDATLAIALFATMVLMSLAPKLLGALDVALERGGVRRFGGPLRFASGLILDIVFGMLMAPVVAVQLTIFMLGLPFGRRIGWSGQIRDAYGLEWSTALRGLWLQTVFGFALLGVIGVNAPSLLVWAAPVIAGLILAVPFAVVTASPRLGSAMARHDVCASPEEITPAAALQAIEDCPQAQVATKA
ncbi:MAG: glucans biosynthesis glucosyltransferase MdoH [Neomegalonema sp.]